MNVVENDDLVRRLIKMPPEIIQTVLREYDFLTQLKVMVVLSEKSHRSAKLREFRATYKNVDTYVYDWDNNSNLHFVFTSHTKLFLQEVKQFLESYFNQYFVIRGIDISTTNDRLKEV